MPVASDLGNGLSSDKGPERVEEPSGRFHGRIHPGDVLAVSADSEEARNWKGTTDTIWYVYVTRVKRTPSDRQVLNVLWLYKPADTICKNALYVFEKELFMSDHCNCEHEVEIDDSVVLHKVTVKFHGGLTDSSGEDFFIRFTYHEEEHYFVTYKNSHRYCVHHKTTLTPFEEVMNKYQIDETVLVAVSESRLDPCEIVGFLHQPDYCVLLRRLRCRSEIDENGKAPANELVYTEELFETSAENVMRKCPLRFYAAKDLQQIPAPYNRNGTGDAFFITTRIKGPVSSSVSGQDTESQLIPIEDDTPETMIEGFNPEIKPVREKL